MHIAARRREITHAQKRDKIERRGTRMRKKGLTRREFIVTASAGLAAAGAAPPRAPAMSGTPNALALNGGTPVRSNPYPSWPQTSELDEQNLLKPLRNHRSCTFDGAFITKFEKAGTENI